jgi:hypothetical protein
MKMEDKRANLTVKHFAPMIVAGAAALAAGAASGFEITQPIPGKEKETACLDVRAFNTSGGTPIDAYPCNGGFNEQWNFDDQGHLEGIGTANGATECLEANGSNQAILSSCSQTWGLTFASGPSGTSNWIFLEPGGASLSCLDSNGKYGSTAQVVVHGCVAGTSSQSWVLQDIVITQPNPNPKVQVPVETICVDVANGAINNGAPVNAYPCNLAGNERWTYVDGELHGVSSQGKTTCLGWDNATHKVELETETSCGTNNTLWQISGGTITTSTEIGAACLDSKNGPGAQLIVNTCFSPPPSSQLWSLR